MGGPDAQKLSTNSAYFIAVSMVGLAVSAWLNVIGLNVGKWLSNVGAVAGWIALAILIPFGLYSGFRFGSATPITPQSLVPGAGLKELIFISTIAFAYAGVENASTMGEEIVDARRTVPRAVIVSAVVIAALYIVGTLSILLALPPDQISGLQGLVQAMQAIARRSGVPWLVPIVAALVVVNVLGAVAGWFAATARLPFVAGVDRFLPEVFGRLHPRWQTPHVALLVQAALAAVFIVLGQAGTSVRRLGPLRPCGCARHRPVHPVPFHVCGHGGAAARACRPRSHPDSRRRARRTAARRGRICRQRGHDRPRVRPRV
jgi:amino acid transporter